MDARAPTPFSADDLRMRVAREQMPHAGPGYGDHTLNPDLHEMIAGNSLRDAAVLIPVIEHGEEATVLLTQRAEKLRSHSGQVAFPGGRIDPTDASAEDAALRETFEEIGLPARSDRGDRADAGLCHRLRLPHRAGASASSSPASSLSINEEEVDAAFEVPLGFLMDPANHRARKPRLAGARALLLHHALWRPLHLGRDGRHHPHALRKALRVSQTVSIAGKADWLSNKHLQRLLFVLSQDGEEARVAGGAVRNTSARPARDGHRHRDDDAARGNGAAGRSGRLQDGADRHRAWHRSRWSPPAGRMK